MAHVSFGFVELAGYISRMLPDVGSERGGRGGEKVNIRTVGKCNDYCIQPGSNNVKQSQPLRQSRLQNRRPRVNSTVSALTRRGTHLNLEKFAGKESPGSLVVGHDMCRC